MLDRNTIELVVGLAEAKHRQSAASELAAHVSARSLLIFVHDRDVDAMLPAPGLPQTIPGGESWRRLLEACQTPGLHQADVGYPTSDAIVPATAVAGSGIAVVFVGPSIDEFKLEAIIVLLPLIAAALHAEQAGAITAGELKVAREDARHAAQLARSLDAVRVDLERQAKNVADARARAEEAARAKDEFLAMLGHELRNPLAPIVTTLQLQRLRGNSTPEQAVLERQVAQLTRLVDDLLDVSRIARGQIELRREKIDLKTVLTRAIEAASPLFEAKQQELSVRVPERDLIVDADPARLGQVFSNLLTNASKYSDAKSRVEVTASSNAERISIAIKDEGDGIEPHMLDTIFERFVQRKQSVERSQGGLGLGLAIVKSLVMLHGGSVRVASGGLNMGSEFIVELPSSSGSAPLETVSASTLRAPPIAPIATRVLIVDDNVDAAESLGELLSDMGYDIQIAHDGPSALEIAGAFEPSIALLDIGLPVMDGYELGAALRRMFNDAIRLCALTGYGQASDRLRSREAGFDLHLVKPIDIAALEKSLAAFAEAPIVT